MNKNRNLKIEDVFSSAIQNHKKKKFVIAENLYKEILKKNPNHFQSISIILNHLQSFSIIFNHFQTTQMIGND